MFQKRRKHETARQVNSNFRNDSVPTNDLYTFLANSEKRSRLDAERRKVSPRRYFSNIVSITVYLIIFDKYGHVLQVANRARSHESSASFGSHGKQIQVHVPPSPLVRVMRVRGPDCTETQERGGDGSAGPSTRPAQGTLNSCPSPMLAAE